MKRIFISASIGAMLITSSAMVSSCNGGAAAIANAVVTASTSSPSENIETYGKIVSKEMHADNITGLNIAGCADITYIQGDETRVKMETNEKAFDLYDIKTEGNTLNVYMKNNKNNRKTPIIYITVTSPAIKDIDCSGAANINIENIELKDNGLDIDISGAGKINAGNITCGKNLTIDISGAGDINAEKIECAQDVSMGVSGAGNINGGVKCKNLDIQISGTGNVDMDIDCDNTSAAVSGTGSVKLNGRTGTLKKNRGNMFCKFNTDNLAVGK